MSCAAPATTTRSTGNTPESSHDAIRWLEEHGDTLYRHACYRLGRPEDARDVVQDTLLAAWKARQQGVSVRDEKSWLFGILKHKILDQLRRRYREKNCAVMELQDIENAQFESGRTLSHWQEQASPRRWTCVQEGPEREEFQQALEQCLEKLPPRAARAFVLREVDGLSPHDLSSTLNLTLNNVFVLLHRARLALRRCLDVNWGPASRD